MDLAHIGAKLGMIYVPLLFSLCFHEYAHGWVAKKKGDMTAQMLGRLSMNPVVHADIIGTVVLPIAMIIMGGGVFGWGKPVPVNSLNLKNPKYDMFWIAAAGPLSNILLSIVGAFLIAVVSLHFMSLSYSKALLSFLSFFVQINLILAFFNLIPLHPLDGGKVLARFLPDHVNNKLEANQHLTSIVLLMLFFSGALGFLLSPVLNIGAYLELFFVGLLG